MLFKIFDFTWYFYVVDVDKTCKILLILFHLITYQQHSIYNKTEKSKIDTCSHHCPLRHPMPSLGHWCTSLYLQILRFGSELSNHLPGTLLPGYYRSQIVSSRRPHPSSKVIVISNSIVNTITIYIDFN